MSARTCVASGLPSVLDPSVELARRLAAEHVIGAAAAGCDRVSVPRAVESLLGAP